ncbi:DUF1272 domain-containing protein [Albibacillus kandeliae]|uniref:DUF1272 domain-containing protein n=1 Tax=Albibacillus kandeliae TaxID=2174228 RepID=UPI000D69AEF9|nr:DUF1272 domain-containing protein [Albibacillus kandeliae]
MLELRPNCEICDRDLPPQSGEARICTYECTYCADCAESVLHGVCQNCGGNLVPRPIRPRQDWRPGTGLGFHPAGTTRRHGKWSEAERNALVAKLCAVPPDQR